MWWNWARRWLCRAGAFGTRAEVTPPDFLAYLLAVADVAFLGGLVLMALLSWSAAGHIGPDERVPMQWGLNGRPVWRASRRTALLFSPALAAGFGLLLTALSHLGPRELTQEAVTQAIARSGMALAFVVAHMVHLGIALSWLRRQRERK